MSQHHLTHLIGCFDKYCQILELSPHPLLLREGNSGIILLFFFFLINFGSFFIQEAYANSFYTFFFFTFQK